MSSPRAITTDLPDWFDLGRYTADFSELHWYREILGRYIFQQDLESIERGLLAVTKADLAEKFRAWLTSPREGFDDRPPEELHHISPMVEMSGRSELDPRFGINVTVMVNLSTDDEVLKQAFSIWLAGQRAELGLARRGFDDRDFKHWHEFGILPAFDLTLWKRLEKSGYTDASIAKAIWPDEAIDAKDVVVSERFRKVTKPLLLRVFSMVETMRFMSQHELSRSMAAMVDRNQAERK